MIVLKKPAGKMLASSLGQRPKKPAGKMKNNNIFPYSLIDSLLYLYLVRCVWQIYYCIFFFETRFIIVFVPCYLCLTDSLLYLRCISIVLVVWLTNYYFLYLVSCVLLTDSLLYLVRCVHVNLLTIQIYVYYPQLGTGVQRTNVHKTD